MARHEPKFTLGEEIANSITHGVGVVLSIVGLTLLVVYASFGADPWRIVSVSVFGSALILMYLASTLYHALRHPSAKRVLRICDHCSIYLLIAGTYTPVLLVSMRGPWGWSLFGVLWGIAIAGCLYKTFFLERQYRYRWKGWVSTALYVAMGWTAIVALKPTLAMVPAGALILLLIGGLAYTSGVIFYLWERLPYNHAIWHLFVLGGSVAHFFAIFYFVLPLPHGAV